MTLAAPVVVVAGPTAVGKTSLAIEVASRLGAEIIGADSRQIYRGLDVGTGKPARDQLEAVPHHLVDCADPDEVFSAARFASEAAAVIRGLDATGRRAVVVGGTGLYLRALRTGLFPAPGRDDAYRESLRGRAADSGTGALHRELAAVDPEAAARIHDRDLVRIIRALEVHRQTGLPISRLQRERTIPPLPGRRFVGILLTRGPGDLAEAIARRVRAMLAQGWPEEVARILAAGYDRECPGMQSLGYRTVARLVDGGLGMEEAAEMITNETRRYAKRQMTWFRAEQWDLVLDLSSVTAAAAIAEAMRVAGGADAA